MLKIERITMIYQSGARFWHLPGPICPYTALVVTDKIVCIVICWWNSGMNRHVQMPCEGFQFSLAIYPALSAWLRFQCCPPTTVEQLNLWFCINLLLHFPLLKLLHPTTLLIIDFVQIIRYLLMPKNAFRLHSFVILKTFCSTSRGANCQNAII